MKLTEVTSHLQLPRIYLGLPNDLDEAVRIVNAREAKLFSRGYRVVRPLNVFRLTTKTNTHDQGKTRVSTDRAVASVMLAVEMEEVAHAAKG